MSILTSTSCCPCFGHIAFDDDIMCAKVISCFYVNELMVPLMMQGATKRQFLSAVVEVLRAVVESMPVEAHPILLAARKSILTCFSAVWALLNPCASESDIKCLDRVAESRDGVENHLKQTLMQSQSDKAILQDLRSCEVDHAQFGPLLQEATGQVKEAIEKESVSLDFLKPLFQDLPQWRGAMRSGSTASFEELLCQACEMEKAKLAMANDSEGLEELGLLLATAATNGECEACPESVSKCWGYDNV